MTWVWENKSNKINKSIFTNLTHLKDLLPIAYFKFIFFPSFKMGINLLFIKLIKNFAFLGAKFLSMVHPVLEGAPSDANNKSQKWFLFVKLA